MNYLKKFFEEVGFDDEETRDRLEIPNLRGEFEPSSLTMRPYYIPSDKINTKTELKKLIFRYPILERFVQDSTRIEGSLLVSFFATSKTQVDDTEYYTQLSFAYHDGGYYIGSILRDRMQDNENEWVKHSFTFNEIEDVFVVTEAFLKCCSQLGILDSKDLGEYDFLFN